MDNQDSTPIVISREDAKAQGLKRYFTGGACKHGHIAERLISNQGCMTCASIRYHKWLDENRDKAASATKRWTASNQGRHKANRKRWKEANKEKEAFCVKRWHSQNPECHKRASTKWQKSNPEKSRAATHNYNARKRGAEGAHTAQDVKDLYAAQKGRCAYCKVKVGKKFHVDHIQPISTGGGNSKDNLQICCARCNQSKGAKDPIDYAQSLGLLI
jgi:5-methylcytosine-specific restriction endonuclease McrA